MARGPAGPLDALFPHLERRSHGRNTPGGVLTLRFIHTYPDGYPTADSKEILVIRGQRPCLRTHPPCFTTRRDCHG